MADRMHAQREKPRPGLVDEPDEATLIAAAQRDLRQFGPLYARYVGPVYRYCHRRLGNRADAEDATSAIFVRALTSLHRYQEGSFRGWLFTIAHRVVTDAFRRAPPAPQSPAGAELIDPAPGPDELALAGQERSHVLALLARLPDDQREVLELRLSGLRSTEVARIIGRTPVAVRSLQFRAVSRLRELRDEPTATRDRDGEEVSS